MRVTAQILGMTLLAGLAAAQTAPASQTVQANPQQPTAKPATGAAAKSPFAPKGKVTKTTAPSQTKTASTAKAKTQAATKPATPPSATKPNGTSSAVAKPPTKAPVTAKPAAQASASQTKVPSPANAPVSAKTQVPAKPVAQTAAPKSKTAAPAQAATAKAKQPAPATAKETAKNTPKPANAAKEAAKNTPKPANAKNVPVQAKVAPKPEASAPAPEKKAEPAPVAQNEPLNKLPNPGKRDPFLSPLAAAAARGVAANCTSGKRCLVVDQIVLKGIVQMRDGNMALVENGAKRPYVLHESDSLFNGVVVKITGDSMILREDSSDVLGRPVSKEVIKKVSAPSV